MLICLFCAWVSNELKGHDGAAFSQHAASSHKQPHAELTGLLLRFTVSSRYSKANERRLHMKFSDIHSSEWDNIKPYMDTALLPLTGLNGLETPWEATIALEQLRDVLDLVELPYKGRVITYPAVHYTIGEEPELQVNSICRSLKEAGFTYVIAMTAQEVVSAWNLAGADLFLYVNWDDVHINPEMAKQNIAQLVQRLWRRE